VLNVRRFDARRSRLEGKTECGKVWLWCGGFLYDQRGGGGEGRRSASGVGAPSNHRPAMGEEIR
jgi:hypothetical protein